MRVFTYVTSSLTESRSLGWERKLGRIFDLKLNIFSSPIVNKYREGKVQSTLKRELNVPEIVANQAIVTSLQLEMCPRGWVMSFAPRVYRSHKQR